VIIVFIMATKTCQLYCPVFCIVKLSKLLVILLMIEIGYTNSTEVYSITSELSSDDRCFSTSYKTILEIEEEIGDLLEYGLIDTDHYPAEVMPTGCVDGSPHSSVTSHQDYLDHIQPYNFTLYLEGIKGNLAPALRNLDQLILISSGEAGILTGYITSNYTITSCSIPSIYIRVKVRITELTIEGHETIDDVINSNYILDATNTSLHYYLIELFRNYTTGDWACPMIINNENTSEGVLESIQILNTTFSDLKTDDARIMLRIGDIEDDLNYEKDNEILNNKELFILLVSSISLLVVLNSVLFIKVVKLSNNIKTKDSSWKINN
jgi:hypothetical protein